MAEILGTAAAIAQFVDVAVRLSSGLGRLCSEVRNVPRHFHRLQVDLRQQIEVAQHIQSHYLPAFATTVASSEFDAPLLEYITLADELCMTLDKLLANNTDGLLQRGWSGLCSVRKKDYLFQMCDRLEQRKSTLSMWLSAANLKLSTNVTATADQVKINVDETLTLTKTVEENSNKAVASTEQLLPQLEQKSRVIASSSEKTEQMMRDVQQLKAQSAVILADTGAKFQKWNLIDQASTRIFSNTELILQNLQHLSLRSGEAGASVQTGLFASGSPAIDVHQPRFEPADTIQSHAANFLKLIADNDSLADQLSNLVLQRVPNLTSPRRLEHLKQSYVNLNWKYGRDVLADAHAGNCTGCICRTVNNVRRWQPLSVLHFTRIFRTQHFSFCPEYRSSEQSLEFVMQLVPPSWLLSHTINLGIQVRNWWTLKAFSISPIIVGTSRLVDPIFSPAFRAIMDTKEELLGTGLHRICIPRLQNTLKDLFDQQKASALDTDCNGRTMLNEVLWIYTRHIHRRLGDEYVSLIQFLLDKGADPNILSTSAAMEASDRFDDVGGATFDQFAKRLLGHNQGRRSSIVLASTKRRNLTIFKRLAAAGSEFSKPFDSMMRIDSTYRCKLFSFEVQEFTDFEEQMDLCKFGGLIPIIIQQHRRQFQRAVNKANRSDLNHSSPINGLAPAHFAVLWPSLLKILIAKGANVNAEDRYGRRPIHLAVALGLADAVECLLNADCALFSPSHDLSLLQHALQLRGPQRQQILGLLVPALIDCHTRLLDMAREFLPCSSFSKLDITKGQKMERYAPWISEILVSDGIDVPEALDLDGKSFYDFAHMHGSINLTSDVANAFWSAGFEDINEPDENGLTPFLQSWFYANFEMITWFAEKGVSLPLRHRDAPLSALHLYAHRIMYSGAVFSRNIDAVPTDKYHMARIQEEAGILYDECTCLCSPSGCTPVKFLSWDLFYGSSRKAMFRKWLENVKPEKDLLQQYVREFTRCLLFNFLAGKHTCCSLGERCSIETKDGNAISKSCKRINDKWQRRDDEHWERVRKHYSYCEDGIPIPRKDAAFFTEDADRLEMTLNSCMSHYDEMPRPDTMPPEEQPFNYLNRITAERDMTVDVRFKCSTCAS